MSSPNDSITSQPAAEKDESAETIYDRIYERVCSLLTQEPIAKLRDMLRSIMTHEDLTTFCTNRSRLSLISYAPPIGDHGPARAFRSSLLSVRLVIFVETDRSDAEVERVQITADIQDGNESGTRPLVEWARGTATGGGESER